MRGIPKVTRSQASTWLITLLVSAGVTGCFRVPVFSPAGIEQDKTSSQMTCEALPTLGRGDVRTFRAMLDTSLRTDTDETFSFRYAVVSKQPHDMRVDLLPPEGAYTLGLLVIRDREALIIDSQSKTFAAAKEPLVLFEKFFSLQGVTPDLVKALIVGQVPPLHCSSTTVYSQDGKRLLLIDAATQYAWEVEQETGRVYRVLLLDDALRGIQAEATRTYAPADESVMIALHKPVSIFISMKIRKLTLNPVVSEELFRVQPPSGYEDESY